MGNQYNLIRKCYFLIEIPIMPYKKISASYRKPIKSFNKSINF